MENEVMNNTEIPAMFLKLNGKWGYEQYGNTSHVLKLNGKWGYEQYGNTNHVLKLNGKWGYEQYGNTSHVFKTKWKMRLLTIRKYQPCF